MKRKITLALGPALAGLLIVLSLGVAACSTFGTGATGNNPYGGSASSGGGASSGNVAVTGGGTVRVANIPQLGQILATPVGKTLYTNTVDTPGNLRCVDIKRRGIWKPFTMDTQPTAGNEIAGKLELITCPDGTKQVAYNQLYEKQQADAQLLLAHPPHHAVFTQPTLETDKVVRTQTYSLKDCKSGSTRSI